MDWVCNKFDLSVGLTVNYIQAKYEDVYATVDKHENTSVKKKHQ